MKATLIPVTDLLVKKHQLIIPEYQRKYSWSEKPCKKLWSNIVNLQEGNKKHFLGSIVRFNFKASTDIPQYIIIDGQQRITTIILIILAIIANTSSLNRRNELLEEYIIHKDIINNYKHYKLVSNEEDKNALTSIVNQINNNSPHYEKSMYNNLIFKNFELFKKLVYSNNAEDIWYSIKKLLIVDINLNAEIDTPQSIFEHLNSTGLPLCSADLIRNYILMQFSPAEQTEIYRSLWQPMEKNFEQLDFNNYFNQFFKHYLISKKFEVIDNNDLYEEFKKYIKKLDSNKYLVQDMNNFSKYYTNMIYGKESNLKIKNKILEINTLGKTAHLPFLLNVYKDYVENIITENEFLEVLNIIASLLFRRIICNKPSNALTRFFAKLYNFIDRNYYLDSFKRAINQHIDFPTNNEFKANLLTKNIYSHGVYCKYFLTKLENFNRKEPIQISNYTIEHIMPVTLTTTWRECLGEDFENIHAEYLHTIGNLTLTGYNTELSNKSFTDKLVYFKTSPLWLNNIIISENTWNKESIKIRCETIFNRAIEIWPSLVISKEYQELIKNNKDSANDENIYSLSLTQDIINKLYTTIKDNILKLDPLIIEKHLKHYIAFQINTTNFITLTPRMEKIDIFLKLHINDTINSTIQCEDYSKIGHWGTGNVKINFNNINELNDLMKLVKLAYNKALNNI